MNHPEDPAIASPQPWFTHVYPKEHNIFPQQAAYIKDYIDDLEAALYGPNFTDPALGYAAWMDVEASIDHHILVTFSKDPDALRLSTYLYKPRGGKLAFGPIWDFDRTMGCDSDNRSADPTGWDPPNETAQFFQYDYWGRLFQDDNFMQKWIDRWQELREGEFSNANLIARVDALSNEVDAAQPRNASKWPEVAPNGGPLTGIGGWDGEIDHLKNLADPAGGLDRHAVHFPTQLQTGGVVNSGDDITASTPQGTLYYTTDGSDPRLPGGGINPNAIAIGSVQTTLVSDSTTPVEVLHPMTSSPGPTAWTLPGFNASGWQTGFFGVGYDQQTTYDSLINVDVNNGSGNQATSIYIRVPFTVADASAVTNLTLRVKYDDGFIAYLNGTRVESANAPSSTPLWNDRATANHPDSSALNFIDFDLTDDVGSLVTGSNLLAIHSLNRGSTGPTNSSSSNLDMLLSARLIATTANTNQISINDTTTIIARSLDGSDWSGPVQETYIVGTPASSSNLVVSEIMYHPAPVTAAEMAAGFTDESDFEFVELQNVGNETIDLSGVVISMSFDFDFIQSSITTLAPGETLLLVRNQAAFEERYGTGLPVAGEWGNPADPDGGSKLSNGGEQFVITGNDGGTILDFTYSDDFGWPQEPDGQGASLVLNDPNSLPDHNLGTSWRASLTHLGTPGVPHDDLCSEWIALHFTQAEIDAGLITGDDDNPDSDHLKNLLELIMGGDPRVPSPELCPVSAILSLNVGGNVNDYYTVSFQRVKNLPGLTSGAQFSSDLQDWTSEGVLHSVIDNGDGTETVIYRDPLVAG